MDDAGYLAAQKLQWPLKKFIRYLIDFEMFFKPLQHVELVHGVQSIISSVIRVGAFTKCWRWKRKLEWII